VIWVKRFLADLFGAQIDGFRFARGMFWLFALMAVWEFGQHVIEVRIGFFDSAAASKAVAMDATRMALGWVKMILVYAGGFSSRSDICCGAMRGERCVCRAATCYGTRPISSTRWRCSRWSSTPAAWSRRDR
jgi:hypothetical protein